MDMARLEEAAVEFAENPEPRCACLLLLDTSSSMQGEPIQALNAGLRTLKDALSRDPVASRRVEVAIVTFDNRVIVAQDFVTIDKFEPPTLQAQGQTFMGTAILQALDMVHERKAVYRQNGVSYFRSWVFMITDGEPQGEPDEIIDKAVRRISSEDNDETKRLFFYAVGVEGANMERLKAIAVRPPYRLAGLQFGELFRWASASMGKGGQVALPSAMKPA